MRKRYFTRQVGLTFSEETYDQLIEQTSRKEVIISEWLREAIEERLLLENLPHGQYWKAHIFYGRLRPVCCGSSLSSPSPTIC